MKYIKQLVIILAVTFVGEALSYIIPLPIPASIYGLVLLFVGLCTHIIPYESVKDTGHFLIQIMPIMFIPAAVGVLDSWGIIQGAWVQYAAITIITTVVVMAVAGRVTQYFVRKGDKKNV